MKHNLLKKGIVLGIIVLFVGASVLPSISGFDKDAENINYILNEDETLNLKIDDYNNLIKQAIENRVLSNNGWLEQDKLLALDGTLQDEFGYSVSIDGDYAIIGANHDSDVGQYSGSAYVFKRNGTTWIEEQKLTASDAVERENFGWSVYIDGDYALIGAPGDDDNGEWSGSVYVFKRNGTTWIEEQKLTASDAEIRDCFGCSVSLNGDYAIIGAEEYLFTSGRTGSAYVFKREDDSWSQQAKLLASDGAADDQFGRSVSIDGDNAIIGAPLDDDNGEDSGSTYFFKRTGSDWTQKAKLLASGGTENDRFGCAVSIHGDYAIIGAFFNWSIEEYYGSAYVFRRNGTTWIEEQKLTAPDYVEGELFGYSISIDGDYALIGAPVVWDDYGTGSAYVFKREDDSWSQQARLLASDGEELDYFGRTVSIDGDYAIIGAFGDDDNGDLSGSAYVFTKSGGNQPDLTITQEDINIPNYIVEGHPYQIKATVRNIGEATAQYNFKVRFLEWGPSDNNWVTLETLNIFKLNPGESITKGTWWYPDEPGAYLIKVTVDTEDVIEESDENNNEAITTAYALPIVSVIPARQYHSSTETLDIDALFYNNVYGHYMDEGIATWKIYDQEGTQLLNGELTFNENSDYWEAHDIDVSSLTIGETYTVRVIWYYREPYVELDFRKTSGYCFIEGYVKDVRTGDPINNANVRLYLPWKFPLFPPEKITYTNEEGFYSFGPVVAYPYWGYIVFAVATDYYWQIKGIFSKSDETYQVDFWLTNKKEVMFKMLLDPLNSSCHTAAETETEMLGKMMNKVRGFSKHDYWWDVADVAASLMVGAAEEIPQDIGGKIGKETAVSVTQEALKKAVLRKLPELLEEKFKDIVWDELFNLIVNNLCDLVEIYTSDFYVEVSGSINEYHDDFQSNVPPSLDSNFDFERANGVVSYITQQLNNVEDIEVIVIPFDYEHPQDLLFPSSKDGFDITVAAMEAAGATRKAMIIAQIGCGIAAIGLAIFTGGASLTLLAVAHGLGQVGDVAGYGETVAKCAAYIAFGTGVGDWAKDLTMLPSIMYTSSEWFLNEGTDAYYLNETKDFNVAISHFVFTPDWTIPFFGTKIVFAPWNGGKADKPVEIVVENKEDYKMNVFAQINKDRKTKKDLQGGETWQIDDQAYYYWVDAYNPWTTFIPRYFKVNVRAGLPVPVFPSDSREVEYYVLPKLWKGTIGPDTTLPMSTSEGRLTFDDIGEFFPRENPLFDVNLTSENHVFETNYTVSENASSVEFYMFYPSASIIGFSVFDSDGNRIGYNYSTGTDDVEFIGSFSGKSSNPQVISIPRATNKTYKVRTAIAMQYSANESHLVVVKAFEIPDRPTVLSVDTNEIFVSAAPGTNVSIPVMFGEAGMYEALNNASLEISDVEKDGFVLPNVSDAVIDVGPVLPGTGSGFSFVLYVPEEAEVGDYIGFITVNASNAEAVPVDVIVRVSNPPGKPTIDGPTTGKPGREYDYKFVAIDPEGNDVYYYVDWGDDTSSGWIGPYSSGEEVTLSHTWSEQGTYVIRAKAKDINDLVGPWGTLEVTMPRSKAIQTSLFLRFLQNHPNLFLILQRLFQRLGL